MSSKGKSGKTRTGSTHGSKSVIANSFGAPNPQGDNIAAGKLNRRIKIMAPVDTPIGGGNEQRTWKLFYECWASVLPMSAHEVFVYQQLDEQLPYTVTVRYRLGITPMMQVWYKNRKLEIQQVIDKNECHEQIIMIATELQAGGVTA